LPLVNYRPHNLASGLRHALVSLPRGGKQSIAVGFDLSSCVLATILAFYLRVGYLPNTVGLIALVALASSAISIPLFWFHRIYRTLLRHERIMTARPLARAILIYTIPFALIFSVWGVDGVPRTLGLLQPLILLALCVAGRGLAAGFLSPFYDKLTVRKTVLIYGAGVAGRQLASALRNSELHLRGFVDQDPALIGQVMDDCPILSPQDLPVEICRLGVDRILLAIPSASRRRRREIIETLAELPVEIQTLPAILDLAHGKLTVSDLKNVDIEDLLGRDRVIPDPAMLEANLLGQVILVTGAGGSIGSELCRQILASRPQTIILFEISEFALYSIHSECQAFAAREGFSVALVQVLGSVHDRQRVEEVIATYKPYVIFHAAAYKHVPLVEANVLEGVRNNVLGTRELALAARKYGVPHFILISTDKAVRPTSVMGATKRMGEQILQALAASGGDTTFSMVRFGNVLGSSGSVVPLFRSQIAAGGPVTVTHRDMTRYFMMIPEAAQLVIQAGTMAKGGEVFLLDMGEPVRIMDLARNIIHFSGLLVRDEENPAGDIEIAEVGLRPGEKLYEELLIGGQVEQTLHPLIMKADEPSLGWKEMEKEMASLELACTERRTDKAIAILKRAVPDFCHSTDGDIADCPITSQNKTRNFQPARLASRPTLRY